MASMKTFDVESGHARRGFARGKFASGKTMARIGWAASLLCVACSGEQGSGDSVAGFEGMQVGTMEEVSGLDTVLPTKFIEKTNGTVQFGPGCSAAEQTKVRSAMTLLMSALQGIKLNMCLSEAFLSYTRRTDVDTIAGRLRESMPTQIDCTTQQGAGITGDIGVNFERLALDHSALQSNTEAEVAATIAHEISHNKGYRHPENGNFDRDYSVPYVIGNCIHSIALNHNPARPHWEIDSLGQTFVNTSRRTLRDEVRTAQVGETVPANGLLWDLRCPGTQVSTALAVGVSSIFPRGIAVNCATATAATSSVGFGAFNGTGDIAVGCPANSVLVGVIGTSAGVAANINGLCAQTAFVEAKIQTVSSVIRTMASLGDNYIRLCPPGMAVNGVTGHTNPTGELGEFGVTCRDMAAPATGASRWLDFVGSTAAAPQKALNVVECEGRGAMVSILGSSTGTTINALGGMCTGIEPLSRRARVRTTQFTEKYIAPVVGEDASSSALVFTDGSNARCPDNEVLIGANIRASTVVSQIEGVCANAEAWTNASAPAPALHTIRARGSAAGTLVGPRCARGEVLTGFAALTAKPSTVTVVNGVIPICRDFRLP
jgi:hypothetical protein